jgi:WD40 repeat protein
MAAYTGERVSISLLRSLSTLLSTLPRWDLKMGQRGLLDRLPVAHSSSVTTLDWRNSHFAMSGPVSADGPGNGLGWLVSGGLDRTVKVWDLTTPGVTARMPTKPIYTLHPSFPVRHVMWRPGYECELAVVSNAEFVTGSGPDKVMGQSVNSNLVVPRTTGAEEGRAQAVPAGCSDLMEIWDVRREWVPKWYLPASVEECGVTGT